MDGVVAAVHCGWHDGLGMFDVERRKGGLALGRLVDVEGKIQGVGVAYVAEILGVEVGRTTLVLENRGVAEVVLNLQGNQEAVVA